MLKSLNVHNFKTFLNTDLQFGRQHLFIGRNNSGKSNLAHLLRFIAATANMDVDLAAGTLPGGIDELGNWQLDKGQTDIRCTCTLDVDGVEQEFTYELRLDRSLVNGMRLDRPSRIRITRERLVVMDGDAQIALLESDGKTAKMAVEEIDAAEKVGMPSTIPAPSNATMLSKVYDLPSNRRMVLFRDYLSVWRYFSLSPYWMRYGPSDYWRGAPSQTNPPSAPWTGLDSYGENLSNAIFHLKNFDERRYRKLIQHVKTVEPSLEAINFLVAPGRAPTPFVELAGQPRASWQGLSDGTLRAVGMAFIIEWAAASSPPHFPGSLSIIEEPENGIFPGLLRRLFDLFEEWAPTAQFIFTSHSPYVIDMFDDKRECVTIFKKAADHSESFHPTKALAGTSVDRFSLSTEYASELIQ